MIKTANTPSKKAGCPTETDCVLFKLAGSEITSEIQGGCLGGYVCGNTGSSGTISRKDPTIKMFLIHQPVQWPT